MMVRGFQTALRLVYPARCTLCGTQVESDFGLCGPCWRDTPFISGLCCDVCGTPLPGEDTGSIELCDDCLSTARPWQRGRAAMLYRDNGRKLVLAFKHGDRHDILRPAASWMMRTASPILTERMLVAPVPLHWLRMLRRTYNQSALLSRAVAHGAGLAHCPDLLLRPRKTRSLDGMGKDERFATLDRAITANPARADLIRNRDVLLVDDVMTSGATLSVATQACLSAGARNVHVLTLARVAKDA